MPMPESFAFALEVSTMQLETNPEDPYSVNIMPATVGDVLYANAGDIETRWVKNMEANPNVRARIDGKVYELKAERVTDGEEMKALGKAWKAKFSMGRDPSTLDKVWAYRLVPR